MTYPRTSIRNRPGGGRGGKREVRRGGGTGRGTAAGGGAERTSARPRSPRPSSRPSARRTPRPAGTARGRRMPGSARRPAGPPPHRDAPDPRCHAWQCSSADGPPLRRHGARAAMPCLDPPYPAASARRLLPPHPYPRPAPPDASSSPASAEPHPCHPAHQQRVSAIHMPHGGHHRRHHRPLDKPPSHSAPPVHCPARAWDVPGPFVGHPGAAVPPPRRRAPARPRRHAACVAHPSPRRPPPARLRRRPAPASGYDTCARLPPPYGRHADGALSAVTHASARSSRAARPLHLGRDPRHPDLPDEEKRLPPDSRTSTSESTRPPRRTTKSV